MGMGDSGPSGTIYTVFDFKKTIRYIRNLISPVWYPQNRFQKQECRPRSISIGSHEDLINAWICVDFIRVRWIVHTSLCLFRFSRVRESHGMLLRVDVSKMFGANSVPESFGE